MSNEINAVSERERNACANVFPIGGGVSTGISTANGAHGRVLAPRTRHANCRLTEEEYAQVVDRAQTLGEKPGEWVRRAVLRQLEAAEVNHPQLGRLEQLLAEFRNMYILDREAQLRLGSRYTVEQFREICAEIVAGKEG